MTAGQIGYGKAKIQLYADSMKPTYTGKQIKSERMEKLYHGTQMITTLRATLISDSRPQAKGCCQDTTAVSTRV